MIRYLHIFYLLFTLPLFGAEWFVAVKGRDSNAGSIDHPFGSISRAQERAKPGDTVYIRGGIYRIKESDIARTVKIWAYVILLDKDGLPGKPITYSAFKDERPVFDFSEVKPHGLRVHAFEVTGSWINIKGIEVVGVQVTAESHTQSICFSNNGSNNVYEQLSMHDGQAIGFYTVRGANNLILNCDAYKNHDYTSEDKLGGNVDGFGAHPKRGCTNNVFRGCRAWFNSDDGYDCINAHESVLFENCWAFYNGYSSDFKSLKDGNGFKVGGYGSTPADRIPDPAPRHVIRFCLAARNKAYGFYSNHHTGGSDWKNNSAYMNKNNFNMLCRLKDNITDVPGAGHKMYNNLGYRSRNRKEIIQVAMDKCDLEYNSFDEPLDLVDADFASLDDKQLMRSRFKDGSVPDVSFLKLSEKNILFEAELFSGVGCFGLSALRMKLKSKDSDMRHSAVYDCTSLGEDASVFVTGLIKTLLDERDIDFISERSTIDFAILCYIKPASTNDLPRNLSDICSHDEDERMYAAIALGKIAADMYNSDMSMIVDALTKALDDESDYVKCAAAYSFGNYGLYLSSSGDAHVAVPLLKKMCLDMIPALRREAACALGELDGEVESRLPLLTSMLDDKCIDVKAAAAESLSELLSKTKVCEKAIIDSLKNALNDEYGRVRCYAVIGLAEIGKRVPSVIPLLCDLKNDQDSEVRREVAEALGETGRGAPFVIPVLCDLMNDKDSDVRRTVASALGEIGLDASSVIPRLCDLMSDQDSGVRIEVAEALGKIYCRHDSGYSGFSDIPFDMRRILKKDELIPAKYIAVAVDVLIKGLNDVEDRVVECCSESLGNMGRHAESALPSLITKKLQESVDLIYADLPLPESKETALIALKHDNAYVRRNAINALGCMNVNDTTVMEALINCLGDKALYNGRDAALALALKGESAVPFLENELNEDNLFVCDRAVYSLANIGFAAKKTESKLIALLDNKDESIVRNCCQALREFKPDASRIVPVLIGLLGDDNQYVRNSAASVLALYRGEAKDAVPVLLKLIMDDIESVDCVVFECLSSVGFDGDVARKLADIELTEECYHSGFNLLSMLSPFSEECFHYVKKNNEFLMNNTSCWNELSWIEFIDRRGPAYSELREYILSHENVSIYLLAYSGEERFLPRVRTAIKKSDLHTKSYYKACARLLGEPAESVVKISQDRPGDFKPKSAWPAIDESRIHKQGRNGHGDGIVTVLVTGILKNEDGMPLTSPRFYRKNDCWLMGESVSDEATIKYDKDTGRFSFHTTVFAAYSMGKGHREPGPYQTGSAMVLIEADGCEPLTVRFFDEMPDVEIMLSKAVHSVNLNALRKSSAEEEMRKEWLPLYTDKGTLYPPDRSSFVKFMPKPSNE